MPEEKWQRALKNGGMLMSSGAQAVVYRQRDARSRALCVLEMSCVRPLIESGLLCALEGQTGRWVWAECAVGEEVGEAVLPPPELNLRERRALRPLEVLFQREPDAHKQAYLARAAYRYMGDYEAFHKGGCVTMNWAFVPGGKARGTSGAAGCSELSLKAGRALEVLRARLSAFDFQLLEALLIYRKPMSQLTCIFEMNREAFIANGLTALRRLARCYDMAVAREWT